MFKNEKNKGILSLILVAGSTAVVAVVARFLSEYLNAYWQLFCRVSIALLLTVVLFRSKINIENVKNASKKDLWLLILRSAAHFAGIVLWVTAVPMTKLFTVTLIDSVPFSAILGWIMMKEKLSAGKLLWTAVTVLGVILVSLKSVGENLTFGTGELLLVISGFSLAFRSVSVRWHHQKLNDWELTSVILLLTTFLLGAVLFIRGENVPSGIVLPNVISLTFIGGVINVINLYFSHYGYRQIEAVLAGNILQLEILFGLVIGFLIFAELPNFREIIGSAVLIFSIYKINKLYKEK